MKTIYKALIFSIFLGTLLLGIGHAYAADEGFAQWGNENIYSAGDIQTVPEGYALTAIGYGSDDWKCMLKIKTAPINSDGTVDFSQVSDWQGSFCPTGAPEGSHIGNEKFFEPTPGYVITGWSWGADTSGGSPDTDSFPPDECFYQEYMNLQSGQKFTWGQPNTGTCANRQYDDETWLKNIIRAPDGRVIVGIGFNLDNDADLSFLAMTTRNVIPPTTCSLTGNGISSDIAITAGQSINWSVSSNPSGLPYFWYVSGGSTQNHVAGEGTGLTNWTGSYPYNSPASYSVYYVVENPAGTVACTSNTINVTVNPGTPPPPPPPAAPTATLSVTPGTVQAGNDVTYNWASTNAASWSWSLNILNSSGAGVAQDSCGTVAAMWAGPTGGNSASGSFIGPATCTGFTYVISYTARNSAGVSATDTKNVTVTASTPPPVSPHPTIVLNPTSLTFNITQGSSVGLTQSFNIKNSGNANLNWAATIQYTSGLGNWLSLDHLSGVIPGNCNCSDDVQVSGNGSFVPGTYHATITISDPNATNNPQVENITMIVAAPTAPPPPPPPPASFDFSLSNQGDKTVLQGNSVTNLVASTLLSGTSQSVSFTISGLPTGATSSFSPSSCTPTCSTTLTITTTGVTSAGTYPVTVTANGGGVTKTTTFNLVVTVPASTTPPTGSITFCLMLADVNLGIATNSAVLPPGLFSINLASTTGFATTTLQTQTWNTTTFAPNRRIISSSNDAQCFTYGNLPLGTYNYSQLAVTGSLWNASQYNDQTAQAVNNVSDFFPYGTFPNATGLITLNSGNANRTLVMFDVDVAGGSCPAPQVTSPLTATVTVGQPFTYTLTASSSTATTFSASGLPPGLSFSTTTNQISGTPTQAGTFNITLNAVNQCVGGVTVQTLVLTVNNTGGTTGSGGGGGGGGGTTIGSGSNGAGGGGGGGNGPVNPNSLIIFNEQVVEPVSGTAVVSWNTNLPATRRVVYDIVSHSVLLSTSSPNLGYAYTTNFIGSPLQTAHQLSIPIDHSKTYYFREISTASSTTAVDYIAYGKEVVLNPQGQTTTTTPSGCYYLSAFLRKDFNNDPQEVTKLQLFLRDIEGYNVQVTGIYDDQTIAAVNAFQVKYKEEVLIPWGYDGTTGTSYVYLLTRKKVNEIYCGTIFPLTLEQQQEVTSYRNFFLGLKNAGIVPSLQTPSTTTPEISTSTTPENVVGEVEPATPGILSRVVANVLSALGFNSCPTSFCGWLNLLLLILILILSYLWYREWNNHRRLQKANEEIDLNKNK